VTSGDRECLEAGCFTYASVRMPVETLEGYEKALAALPGVIAARIVHEDRGTLRDQVVVTHLRTWNAPDEEVDQS
jgi:hypothetical protein